MKTKLTISLVALAIISLGNIIHANTIIRDGDGLTPLHIAAGAGDVKKIKILLKEGADIYSLDSKMGVSVLHKAIYSGNPDAVNILLKNGAVSIINLQSPSNGDTPIHDAIYFKRGNDLRIIKILLSYHPNLFIKNRAGLTPLDSAKVLNDKAVIDLLTRYIDSEFTTNGEALMSAVKNNNLNEAKELLKNKNINIEETDEQGFTPLVWASRQGYTPIVKILLEHGANPNHLDEWMGANAGHKAAFWGHSDVMALLVKYHLNVNVRGGYNGYTPLHDAVSRNHANVVKVLLDAGAKTNIKGHDGKTPMDIAKANNNKEIIKLLSTK